MFAHRPLIWIGQCRRAVKNDRHIIGYASGNFGKAILLGTIDVTLLYLLTDVIGIAPARVSQLMVLVLAGDLMFDLLAGCIAGRAERHGIGYRRLIVLFTLPCALVFAAIYSFPLSGIDDIVVAGALILCFRAVFAAIDVPHNGLLARVTADSHARGRASGYRTIFSSIASITIACAIAPLMHGAVGSAAPERMAWLGIAGGLLFCASLLLAAWCSKPAHNAAPARHRQLSTRRLFPRPDSLFAAMASIALITGFATPMFVKTLLYLCTYVLQSPEFAGQVLLMLAVSQILGAMFWIAMVRHQDKTSLLAMSHAITVVGIVLFAAAGENRIALLTYAALIGIGFAGVFMLPWGILADIIDFSEFRYRDRRETLSFAVMLVLLKGGGAAALATIGGTLAALGYVPGAVQPPSVLLGMKVLAFGVPAVGSGIAILILRHLDIGHTLHARVSRVNRMRRTRLG
ncbi:MFS transporter [Pseudoduganella sp. RAF19]|uniref:MFS transporter n=1 Tax=Pseudoduganella sp. RAF19 TaxID=3233052 RepID=UPI003F9AF30E